MNFLINAAFLNKNAVPVSVPPAAGSWSINNESQQNVGRLFAEAAHCFESQVPLYNIRSTNESMITKCIHLVITVDKARIIVKREDSADDLAHFPSFIV